MTFFLILVMTKMLSCEKHCKAEAEEFTLQKTFNLLLFQSLEHKIWLLTGSYTARWICTEIHHQDLQESDFFDISL